LEIQLLEQLLTGLFVWFYFSYHCKHKNTPTPHSTRQFLESFIFIFGSYSYKSTLLKLRRVLCAFSSPRSLGLSFQQQIYQEYLAMELCALKCEWLVALNAQHELLKHQHNELVTKC
jgi:hypothetical protein